MSGHGHGSEQVQRFTTRQRVEHVAVMTLFLVLALTGFPQKYWDSALSAPFVQALGGIGVVRFVHRMSGIAFGLLAAVHLASVVWGAATRRLPLSMVPTRKDFTDALQTLRYYLRLTDRKALFDRYDYREKFEYWGLMAGGMIMTSTGLVLYLPVLTARYLPAELIPVAKVAHSNEGLLAFLTVIVWHLYNVHLAPEVFPFNKTIFTGKIGKEHMREHHTLEYLRLFPEEAPPAGDETKAGGEPGPEPRRPAA
jgi:formate dehydrogenase subunit gamma